MKLVSLLVIIVALSRCFEHANARVKGWLCIAMAGANTLLAASEEGTFWNYVVALVLVMFSISYFVEKELT